MDEVAVITEKWYCPSCNLKFETAEQFGLHNNTKEHEKELRKKQFKYLFCETCDFQYLSKVTYYNHLETKKHKGIKIDLKQFYCKTCEKQYRCKTEFDSHIQTKLHLKRSEGMNYTCEACNYSCKLTHLWNQHCKTTKHLTAITTTTT
jgi:hypothetical protein